MVTQTNVASGLHGAPRKVHEFPNFDYLRLIAASTVIFSHSFTIAQGTEANEPLVRLWGKDNIAAIYGVCVFFMISGFLITMSAVNSRSLLQYAANRLLRIYPALLACQTLCALVLGAMFSTIGVWAFITHLDWARYAYYYTLDPAMSWDIPTVIFFPDAKGTGVGLNGSLWTIQQELFCYLLVGGLRALRLLNKWSVLALLLISLPYLMPWSRNDVEVIMEFINWGIEDTRVYDYFWVGPSFFMGATIFFVWDRNQRLPAWPMAICLVLFLYALHRQHYYDLFPLYFAYPLLWLATTDRIRMPSLKKFGDISYGVYLYGWPMQMMIRGLWGPSIQWWQLFLLAMAAAGLCGYVSWHLLEKPMLTLKRFFRPKDSRPDGEAARLNGAGAAAA